MRNIYEAIKDLFVLIIKDSSHFHGIHKRGKNQKPQSVKIFHKHQNKSNKQKKAVRRRNAN